MARSTRELLVARATTSAKVVRLIGMSLTESACVCVDIEFYKCVVRGGEGVCVRVFV